MRSRDATLVIIGALFVVYLLFSVARPYEDDESLYITSGISVIRGEFNPFVPTWSGHFTNPFQYVIGSPIAPVIYGLLYLAGNPVGMGILGVRLLTALAVLASLIIAAEMATGKKNGSIPLLVIAGLSPAAILLASDAYMDSLALLFLMIGLYLYYKERYMLAGIFIGIASVTKFILFLPFGMMATYSLVHKDRVKSWRFAAMALICLMMFLAAEWRILPYLLDFLLHIRLSMPLVGHTGFFLRALLFAVPASSALCLIMMIRREKFGKEGFLLVPVISIWAFLIIFMDYTSLQRHIMYAELPAAVLASKLLSRIRLKHLALPLVAFAILGLSLSYGAVRVYPSYNALGDRLGIVEGKVLALNHNAFILAKGLSATATADKVYSYYYFNYDGLPGSSLAEYEAGLRDGFFDFALIGSFSSSQYPKYQAIGSMVRKYYCQEYLSNRTDGIDIYRRCG